MPPIFPQIPPRLSLQAESETRLRGLDPRVAELARVLVFTCAANGLNVAIVQGLRTIEEQDALYAQGRTKPGPIVTNAKGGTSYHNYGLAFDIALRKGDGKIHWDTKADVNDNDIPDYNDVGRIGKALGLEWGGDWKKQDLPHFQLSFGLTIADLQKGKRPTT